MAKQGAPFNGGINFEATAQNLVNAWVALMGPVAVRPVIEAHRPAHMAKRGLTDTPERDDRALLLKAIAGCRACALGYVMIRLKVFESRDVPSLDQAVRLKNARQLWERFLAAMDELDKGFSHEERDAVERLDHRLELVGWPLERAPLAIEELERKRGPLSGSFLQDLLEFLRNGDLEWSEIAEMIVLADGPAGAEKRMREAHRIRMRSQGVADDSKDTPAQPE